MAIGKINCPHYNLLISDEGLNRRGLMWIFRKVVTRSSIERRIHRQNLVISSEIPITLQFMGNTFYVMNPNEEDIRIGLRNRLGHYPSIPVFFTFQLATSLDNISAHFTGTGVCPLLCIGMIITTTRELFIQMQTQYFNIQSELFRV